MGNHDWLNDKEGAKAFRRTVAASRNMQLCFIPSLSKGMLYAQAKMDALEVKVRELEEEKKALLAFAEKAIEILAPQEDSSGG